MIGFESIAFLPVLGRGRVSGITYWNWLNAGPGAAQNLAKAALTEMAATEELAKIVGYRMVTS